MSLVLSVTSILLAIGIYYGCVPQLALDNPGTWCLILLSVTGAAVVSINTRMLSEGAKKLLWTLTITGWVLFLLGVLISLPLWRASSYAQLLGPERTADFGKSLPPIDLKNPPLVSHEMALRVAEKQLSNVPALGSQTEVGPMQKQLVNGKLYWVGFLEYSGFFSWWNLGATAGYVQVSATDPSEVKLVTELDGRKLKMRYLSSAYFGDQAERYLRFHGFASAGLIDYSPEIDDTGRPYLVVTVFDRKVGFSGRDALGVVLLDVQTGDTHFYRTADVPQWVDRVQPEEFVKEQLADRLEYVHGWFNPSDQDRLQIAGDLDVVYGADGHAYFYVGLSSTGKDSGLVGFAMIDTRTKDALRYTLQGVTAKVAQATVEGVNPEKHYSATNPLPFLIEGRPSYVMALCDDTGIARLYGIVDVSDYQRVAVANTLEEAARLYQLKVGVDRTHLDDAAAAEQATLTGTVALIGSAVRSGNTVYELTLTEQPGKIFMAEVSLSEELVLTTPGHRVSLQALQGSSRITPLVAFHNLTLTSVTAK